MPEILGEVGAFVHFLHCSGRHVQIMSLDLAGRGRGAVDRFHAKQKAIAPAHERLAVDVLVVFGEIESAAQRFINHASIIAGRKTELGFYGSAQQRTPEFIQVLALHHDPVSRTLKSFCVVRRNPHIFQAQRLERLEAEHVADNRRSQVGDRAFFEKIDIVGDVSNVLIRAGHGIDPVALCLIVLVRRQPIGPHHGPCCRRRLAGHRCRSFDRIHALLAAPDGTRTKCRSPSVRNRPRSNPFPRTA